MPDEAPEWLTVKDFAAALQVSERTVFRWLADPRHPMRVRRFGPRRSVLRIHRSEAEARTTTDA
ncbi:hypothetical protein F0L17_26700 [Streptomyces sp. TRM43335]|uniref:Helix-turn-helix domain-containing protein n=1 Tax=Streptomyces taklimakanensis TaxID=2569853 RepID=A0A6G2BK45_9ACTN|nr:hypothetical protein [Streptomyces taklimakanensis]MTE22620.1 hypothetical protein [Streptomyces taklimakanensis]